MNLTTDPWIPALRADGQRSLFSLQDLFAQGHELRDLAVRPHERIALMRLLLCITQAALDGPKDEDDWEACQPKIQPNVRDYLDKWQGSFELFGERRRFLQLKPGNVAEAIPAMENEGISRLNLSMASGASNSTLFDNSASDDRVFNHAQSALSLISYQCFSSLLGRGYKGRSPCADESMLHTFLIGSNIIATIWRNLLTLETIQDCYAPQGLGRPIWECFPSTQPTQTQLKILTLSYLCRLVPLARSIWLESTSRITLANALVYESFKDCGYREASATIIVRGEQRRLLTAHADRAIWRQLSAICVKKKQNDGVSGPLAFRNPIGDSHIRIWAGALTFPQKNAKIGDSIESSYALPAEMFSDFGRAAYEKGVSHAEEIEGKLIQAIKTHSTQLKIGTPPYNKGRQFFWTRVEQHLDFLFDLARDPNLVADLPNSEWGQAVRQATQSAYEHACPHRTPRQIEAFALGLRKLKFTH